MEALPRRTDGKIAWATMTNAQVCDVIEVADRLGDARLLNAARRVLAKRERPGVVKGRAAFTEHGLSGVFD